MKSLERKRYKLQYHLIFSTKYRKKILDYLFEDIKESFKKIESFQRDWRINSIFVDDNRFYLHIFIKGTPNTRIADIVYKLKQASTYDMWQKHHEYLSRFYWSGKHNLWTKGYFCSTIVEVSEDTLYKYIKNQG